MKIYEPMLWVGLWTELLDWERNMLEDFDTAPIELSPSPVKLPSFSPKEIEILFSRVRKETTAPIPAESRLPAHLEGHDDKARIWTYICLRSEALLLRRNDKATQLSLMSEYFGLRLKQAVKGKNYQDAWRFIEHLIAENPFDENLEVQRMAIGALRKSGSREGKGYLRKLEKVFQKMPHSLDTGTSLLLVLRETGLNKKAKRLQETLKERFDLKQAYFEDQWKSNLAGI